MNTHIEQLTEWWDNAEEGVPGVGDIVIWDTSFRAADAEYTIGTFEGGNDSTSGIRILSRAPKPDPKNKPKPAWHDAVAVIARTDARPLRTLWTPDETDGSRLWITDDDQQPADALRDVTPLIESRVTDDMVDRFIAVQSGPDWTDVAYARHAAEYLLTAALGLDPA